MPTINLIDCLPAPDDGSPKRLLPKQQEFFSSVLDPKGPKYVLYAGGVGSAKTTIGCLTVLALAVLYPGDYLVCRQFLPELKLTTLRTFLALCPPDLIVEHRVADGIIKIRSAGGGVSDVIFRGLDEPGKHRSLNLNAAYIDESSQVSQEAFLLLQSRLRGKHVRKIFLTTNPAGHDWQYQLFVKQDQINPEGRTQFKLIKAPSTENVFLPEDYIRGMLSTYSQERIEREVMASFDAFQGQIYSEFRRDVHVIPSFKIPAEWTKFVGIDHGHVNPMAALWLACDYDGTLYAYREMYQPGWVIEELVKGNRQTGEPGLIARNQGDKLEGLWIDPSTKADRGKESDYSTYLEYLPKDWSLIPANNSVQTGIDRVKEYLKINPKTGKPRLYIFPECQNLIEEMVKYRWKELSAGLANTQNAKEEPVKKDDHACFLGGVTSVETSTGPKDITDVKVGDLVYTSLGYRKVLVSSFMGFKPAWRYDFSNGTSLSATADHPVLLADGTIRPINDLTQCDMVVTLEECKSSLMGSFLGKLARTTERTAAIASGAWSLCIGKFGRPLMAPSRQATTFITGTGTLITTYSLTLSAYPGMSIFRNMRADRTPTVTPQKVVDSLTLSGTSPKSGIEAPKGGNGIGNMLSALRRKWLRTWSRRPALFVRKNTKQKGALPSDPSSATPNVGRKTYVGVGPVYNLHVEGVSEFFANGLLVSNCDALRYSVMSRPEEPKLADRSASRRNEHSLSGAIQRELHRMNNEKTQTDPWKDYVYGKDPGFES